MIPTLPVPFFPPRFRRMQIRWFLPTLACLLLPVAAQAQVSFNGPQNVNVGSQAVGSASAKVSLSFTIGSGTPTTVGSIAVLTTGIAGKDFTLASGSTCTAKTYYTTTKCVVNVTFKPLAAGLRLGAVVFYSNAGNTGTVLATVPVYGVGTGPQVVFARDGAQATVGRNFISPAGVAVDVKGDVFITDLDHMRVYKVTPGGTQTKVGSGFSVPQDVAVDGAGNVFVTDTYADAVYKVTPGGVQTTVGTGFDYPYGIAVDGAGNIYVSDPFLSQVIKVTPAGVQTQVGSGYSEPTGVAVDAAGNVYVADSYAGVVDKITPSGTQTTVGTGLTTPAAVAVDAAGDVYIIDDGTNALYQVTPGGVQTTIMIRLNTPDEVALDGAGNLYIADSYSSKVVKIDRAIPPSLSFDSAKVDTTSKDSPQTVEVENIGNASLKFSALAYPKDFRQGSSDDDDCTSSTSLSAARNCALTIDFHPVTPLGSKTSARLHEAVSLITDTLNVTGTRDRVRVSGTELAPN